MTDRDYPTNRTRDQIADALGGGALADIFIPRWNAIGKLPDLDEPGEPITTCSFAIITAHLPMLPAFAL